MSAGRLLLRDAAQVVTCAGPSPRRGRSMADPGVIPDGAVAIEGRTIRAVGRTPDVLAWVAAAGWRDVPEHSVAGRALVPGFVDPHTHAVFAGTRAAEFEARIAGKTYLEILQAGGGILNTVDAVRAATPAALAAGSRPRLDRMLALGTTTVEVKSGYGLTLESELAMLEAIALLDREGPQELVPTFLGAHAYPRGADRAAYVQDVIERMIPAVAARGLARFIDVFCDAGAFDTVAARRILEAGRRHGLIPKLHADEIESIGATPLGVEMGCISLDHLEKIRPDDIDTLARSATVGVLLPGTAFVLGIGFPPARALIEAGAAVALATDCNPGSCYTESMPMMQMLACVGMRMSPAEALVAATTNAAAALGLGDRLGSLEPGKDADLLVLEPGDYREIAYHFGSSPVRAVLKRGEFRYGRPG